MLGDLSYGNPNGQAKVDQHLNEVTVWSQDTAWGNYEWDKPELDDLGNYKGRFLLPYFLLAVAALSPMSSGYFPARSRISWLNSRKSFSQCFACAGVYR